MTVPPPKHVVLLMNSPSDFVMEPVQAPVKLHVVVRSVEQLMLTGPDPGLQVAVVPVAIACWMALMHPLAPVTCAAAGIPPNPSSNVMIRPTTAAAVRVQNRSRLANLQSILAPP